MHYCPLTVVVIARARTSLVVTKLAIEENKNARLGKYHLKVVLFVMFLRDYLIHLPKRLPIFFLVTREERERGRGGGARVEKGVSGYGYVYLHVLCMCVYASWVQ